MTGGGWLRDNLLCVGVSRQARRELRGLEWGTENRWRGQQVDKGHRQRAGKHESQLKRDSLQTY